jgi:hypothetical protein
LPGAFALPKRLVDLLAHGATMGLPRTRQRTLRILFQSDLKAVVKRFRKIMAHAYCWAGTPGEQAANAGEKQYS